MPELPEVERARRMIEKHCLNKEIIRVFAAEDEIVYKDIKPQKFVKALLKKYIVGVYRKGKHMWVELNDGFCAMFHLGMTGNFQLLKGKQVLDEVFKLKRQTNSEKQQKFLKCEIHFEDDLTLMFSDVRRLGRIRLLKDVYSQPPISELGFDALLELPSVEKLSEIVMKRKLAIKALLLDQSVCAGVGNYIADEVLYQSGIHPERTSSSLTKSEIEAVHICLQYVIQKAVEVDADYTKFPESWLFHSRWGKKQSATSFTGEKIEFVTVGGRTSAFVPSIQPLQPPEWSHNILKPFSLRILDGEERRVGEDNGKGDIHPPTSTEQKSKKKRKAKLDIHSHESQKENDFPTANQSFKMSIRARRSSLSK